MWYVGVGAGLCYFIHTLNLMAPEWVIVHFPHTGVSREVKHKHYWDLYGWNGILDLRQLPLGMVG